MPSLKNLETWAGRSTFGYNGSVQDGTIIRYGQGYKMNITREQYKTLINHFKGKIAQAGTSRTDPPEGSVGE
ncbi:MAG: hypothetical protein Q8M54_08285 [Desulfobaccales bacterium]|nr:hypothetical protein [Desulfobaccales bacterium]